MGLILLFFDILFHEQLQEKLQVCGYSEKLWIQISTLDTWPQETILKDFNVSKYLIWKTLKLKLGDLLTSPRKKIWKRLKTEANQAVLDFYEKNEYCWQMPRKKDHVIFNLKFISKSIFFCIISKNSINNLHIISYTKRTYQCFSG